MSAGEQIALKPCPFCGGKPMPGTWLPIDGNYFFGEQCLSLKNRVVCGHCNAEGTPGTSDKAVIAWNTRASDAQIAGMVEAERERCAVELDKLAATETRARSSI